MITNFAKKTALLSSMLLLFCSVQAQNKPEFFIRGLLETFRKGNNTNQDRIAVLDALIPTSIRSQVTYSLGANSAWYYTQNLSDYTSFNGDTYLDLCRRFDSSGSKFVVDIGEMGNYAQYPDPPAQLTPGVKGYYFTPAQVDSIFKYTTNCIGIESGENFWTYNSSTTGEVISLLRVCKKYNKKYILAEGGWGYNSFTRFFSDNYAILKNEGLGMYFWPTFKNTKPYGALVSLSSVFGSWLTGLTGEFGTWNDAWAWTYGSFGNANEFPRYAKSDNNFIKYPFTHFLKSWLVTTAMGGRINFLETPTFSRQGIPDANFTHYLQPFIEGLIQHDMLPDNSAVLTKVKAIANPYGGTFTLSDGTTAEYTGGNLVSYNYDKVNYKPTSSASYAEPFARLYKMTSGIWNDTTYTNKGSVTDVYYPNARNNTGSPQLLNAVVREMLPNNPRYLIIPLLPHPTAASQVPAGVTTVALSSYQNDETLKTKFESLYPAVPAGTDAWAVDLDNRFFVINSQENADIDQHFVFDLGTDGIRSLSGTMPFQNILFGKREGENNYWFQSSGYAGNDGVTPGQKYVCVIKGTTLHFQCDVQPTVTVEDGKDGSVQQSWNATTGDLSLTINHNAGAVNFRIVANKVSQTTNFNSLPVDKIPGDTDFLPGAISTSGLAVSYSSSNPAVATIVNNQIHIVNSGTTVITASQAGDSLYLAAPEVAQTLTVLPSRPYANNVIPGVIQAENYDIGINGKAYYDTSPGTTGDVNFRPGSDVDVSACNDAGGGYKVQSIVGGEWLDYTVQVAETKNYTVYVRCAYNTIGGKFRIEMDGVDVTGIMNVPNTSNWITWASATKELALTAGTHRMRLYFINGGYHINKLTFSGVTGGQALILAKQEGSSSPTNEDAPDKVTILYPNPFSGNEFNLRVFNKINTDVEVTVYSAMGPCILTKIFTDVKPGGSILKVQLPTISAGVYMANVKTTEGTKTFKIIKQ